MDDQLPHTPKLAYTMRELAQACGVSRSFLYLERKAGRLKVTKFGSRTIITLRQAHEWLALYEKGAQQ